MPRRYTEQDLLDYLQDVDEDLDRPPMKADLDDRDGPSRQTYRRRFGDWNTALTVAGIPVARDRNLPREELVAAIDEMAEALGRPPTKTEMQDWGRYSHGPFERVWDSWADAVADAGYDPQNARTTQPANVRYLRVNGPSPLSTLPNSEVSQSDRMAGVATFHPQPGGRHGQPTPVYYILKLHAPEQVVRAFFDTNSDLQSAQFREPLLRSVGRQWQSAIKNQVDEPAD